MRCGCGCEGCTVGRVWYAPDDRELFPERQWDNMSDEEQGGQGEAEEQEEREEEARVVREMQEDMVLVAEGRGAPGEEGERQRPLAEEPGDVLALQPTQEAAGRREEQTAEERRRSDLEKAAACRNRTQEEMQFRMRAAERLMVDKRAREEEDEDGWPKEAGDGRRPYKWSGSGRVKLVLPGPPGVYSLHGTREEAVGSAVMDQVAEARQAVQEARDQEGADGGAAAGRTREGQQATDSVQQQQRDAGVPRGGRLDGRQVESRLAEQAPRGLHQTGRLPPRTASVVQRLVEEEEELWRTHVEWRRKVHGVMGKLKGVTEEVIRTAPANSRIRKLARVELKTLQRLMECEEHEEARERMQREEAAQRVMRVAESTGEAEEEWTAALQSGAGTAAGGRLPPQGAAEATEEVAGREPQASAGYTPRQQIRRMLQQRQGMADAVEHEEESADTGKQDAEYPQEEQDTDPAVQLQFEQLQQDVRNASMLEMVTVGLREMQEQLKQRSEWAVQRERAAQATADAEHATARNTTGTAVDSAGAEAAAVGPEGPEAGRYSPETPPHAYSPVTLSYSSDAEQMGADAERAAAGADAEQAAEVEQMYREIMQNTQGIGSRRQQQMAVAQQTGYYGPQPGQSAARVAAGGNRRQRAPPQATTEQGQQGGGSSSKRVKARQNMEGVETGDSRVQKSRRASDLSLERTELGNVTVEAALYQVDRWVEQWDQLQGRGSSRHLRVSTPARSSAERWRQGVWSRQQLLDRGHTVWREQEWVGLIEQQYGFGYTNLARLVPWDQQIQLQKYAVSNPEPD